jgi:hypothetical protein
VAWWFLPVNYNYSRSRNMIGFGMLDTSAPGHFSTCVRHFGTKTNRHPDNSAPQWDKSAPQKDKSALVFFSLILRTKLR